MKTVSAPSAHDRFVYHAEAWGETDRPVVMIVNDLAGVRDFFVAQWLGDQNAPELAEVMPDVEQHDFEDGPWSIEFEIGGIEVRRIYFEDLSGSFQGRVEPWLHECFGAKIASDAVERNHRFLEESLELVQSCGCTASEAHQLVDYVFGRPVGEKQQEAGGVMVTLAALCLAQKMDMHTAGETELRRIWPLVDKIRAKQAAKPKHSPLPEAGLNEVEKFRILQRRMPNTVAEMLAAEARELAEQQKVSA